MSSALSVPTKERLRRDHERGPVVAGQEPTGRREECSVGRTKVRTPHLPAQDVQLVTQDRDLDLLGGDGRTYATASTDQPAEHEIEDGPDHGAKMVPIRCPPRRIGLLAPFRQGCGVPTSGPRTR